MQKLPRLQKQKSKWGILFLNPMEFYISTQNRLIPDDKLDFWSKVVFLIKNRSLQFDATKIHLAPASPITMIKNDYPYENHFIIVIGGGGGEIWKS